MEIKLKNKNGITLIALIITIIVLLILAGVALATLTGQGNIIGNAENAVGKYNNSVEEEQQLLNEIEKHFQNYLEGGNAEIVDSADVASEPEKHFGGYVTNYTTPSGDPNVKWRIFYADESNIYLIADDYIHYNYAPQGVTQSITGVGGYQLSFGSECEEDYTGASDITDERITKWISYVKDYSNATGNVMQSVAFMLDVDKWNEKYRNSACAEYAIGGPTLELWCASYEKTHKDNYVETTYNAEGYEVRWNDGSYSNNIEGVDDYKDLYYIKSRTNKAFSMWLASPPEGGSLPYSLEYEGILGSVEGIMTNFYAAGFRPLVCLNSKVRLEKISDTEYRIVE